MQNKTSSEQFGAPEAFRARPVSDRSSTTRILLVEDNPDHAALLRAILTNGEPRRFVLDDATCLDQALEYLVREEVDVVLLDLGLPGCTGMDALRQVHKLIPNTPIVVLTALADETVALRALRSGAQDYLCKGLVDSPQLKRAIRYAIERNRMIAALESATTKLRAANTRLRHVVLLDPLTGTLNRRGLQQVLSREIQWARRTQSELLAVLLDIDEFKWINDTLGHAVGDVVLKEIAGRLKTSVRSTDYVARIGGDEFLILLPQTRLGHGGELAEKVRLTVAETSISLSSGPVKVTASLGVLRVSEKAASVDELLSQMHFLLSQSKQAGKNRVSLDGLDGDKSAPAAQPLSDILGAIRGGEEFSVVRQPIFRLADEKTVGYEFLSRLSNDVFGTPSDFFRLSLEANILTLTDHRCFRNCLAAAASTEPTARRHLNLFPSTMIALPVEHLLEGFPPEPLKGTYCIEISEQQIIGDPMNLAESIGVLRQAGILIAFDDVGYGHSCLESLTLLEPDIIKIDRRCVSGIGQDPSRLRPLRRLVTLAKALGLEVVAEGIESRDDLDVVQGLGVHYGQGFLWGRPQAKASWSS